MANRTLAKPKGFIRDVIFHIHGIPYIITLIVFDCLNVKSDYYMLLGRSWLQYSKVIYDMGNNEVQIMGKDY